MNNDASELAAPTHSYADELELEAETEAVQHTMRARRWAKMAAVWTAAASRAAGDAAFYGRRAA